MCRVVRHIDNPKLFARHYMDGEGVNALEHVSI